MKIIPLTQGYEALIDDEDYVKLSAYSWHALNHKERGYIYAATNYKGKTLYLHNLITGWKIVDHKNHNTLDNRKENLRKSTHQQNCFNTRKHKDAVHSKYKGVTKQRRWRARIRHNYKLIHLGYFNTEEEAALAYNEKAKQLFGEFANLNQV